MKKSKSTAGDLGAGCYDILDRLNEGVITIDTAGNIIQFNKSVLDISGFSKKELMGKKFTDFVHPDDRRRMIENQKKRMMGMDAPSSYEFRIIGKSGGVIYLDLNAYLVKDYAGEIIGIQGIVRDITERKEAERALNERERFMSNIFTSIQDGINILDKDMKIIRVNPVMERWYPHSMPLVGKKCYRAYHGRSKRCKVCPSHRTLKTGKRSYEVVPKRGTGGEITGWLDLYSFPMLDVETGDVTGVIEYVRDITERKAAEEALIRKLLRYNIKKGEVYLIQEKHPDLSSEVFKDAIKCGFKGTVFSRTKRSDIQHTFGMVDSFWFAENSSIKHTIKPKFSEIESRMGVLGAGSNVVLIDRLDYLISKRGFKNTLKFVQRLFEQAHYQKLIVIISLDPKTIKPNELRLLEKETKRMEPKVKSKLQETLYEILKFVYTENRIGQYPSYKDVTEKFNVTRTTVRSRIGKLKAMGFLVDKKIGRTKLLEITDEGREQF